MGQYTIISDISEKIVQCLRADLVPELLSEESAVGLCSPEEHGEISLGVFLYDVQESDEIRRVGMVDRGADRQQYPPVSLSLYYMLTAYSQSDRKFRMIQEQRMLGRVARCFHDNQVLEVEGEQIVLQLQKISTEDKIKLWNFNGEPFRLSLFYKAAPVILESARFRDVVRVRSVEVGTEVKTGGSR